MSNEISKEHWPQVLVYLVDDSSARRWIKDNIINADPVLDWEGACLKFTSHFQSSDHMSTLKREYRRICQQKGESVQSYADRFRELVGQLELNEDDWSVTDHFIEHLSDYIHRGFDRYLTTKQMDDPTFSIESLDTIITLCIRLDVQQKTAALRMPTANSSSHSSSQSQSGGSGTKNARERTDVE
jgi:hypothetical protein